MIGDVRRRYGAAVRRFRHRRLWLFWAVAIAALVVPWSCADLGYRALPSGTPDASTGAPLCTVLRVTDGDTVAVRCGTDPERLRIRLHCIDAPETKQEPWGSMSTAHLTDLIGDRAVEVQEIDRDRYGRIVGRLIVEERDLNLAMVEAGMAAVYPQYCKDAAYYAAERLAQGQGAGIWAVPGAHQAPWEWRR